jgi:hypothetical protein
MSSFSLVRYIYVISESSQQRQTRGSSNGGLFHRQRDSNNSKNSSNSIRPLPEKAAEAAVLPSSASQQLLRREAADLSQPSRAADQWRQRRGRGSHEETLFLNGWSSQFLSSQDISLHVVSQV